ncbi:MAG: ABC transporter permease [Armatimonadetes bacterium]|nr:ABC transporter permease [Armatimonadota bacterium]
MSLLHLVFREIRHRWVSFALGTVAVLAAVSVFLALVTTGRASYRETKRLMRDLGFNLLIVPPATDMADFWARDYAEGDMPEEYVRRLAETPGIGADHYVAKLEKWVQWRGRKVLLTGLLPEYTAVDARVKSPMGYSLGRGQCYVGYAIGRDLGLKAGQIIEVLGRKLKVRRVLTQDGSKEDVRLFAHLHDVQQMLGMEGRINAIEALNCLCTGGSVESVRQKIEQVLPGTQVLQMSTIAEARLRTRRMIKHYAGLVTTLALVMAAVLVALLAAANVSQRRQEIGVLRAMGVDSLRLALMFLARPAMMGLFGALGGFFAGTALALRYGPSLFHLTATAMGPAYDLLAPALVAAPLLAALAAFVPAMSAVAQDPAVTLRDE